MSAPRISSTRPGPVAASESSSPSSINSGRRFLEVFRRASRRRFQWPQLVTRDYSCVTHNVSIYRIDQSTCTSVSETRRGSRPRPVPRLRDRAACTPTLRFTIVSISFLDTINGYVSTRWRECGIAGREGKIRPCLNRIASQCPRFCREWSYFVYRNCIYPELRDIGADETRTRSPQPLFSRPCVAETSKIVSLARSLAR